MDVVASVTKQGAVDTGLLQGTPVIAGTTDTVSEVLGSGAVRIGSSIVKLASVGRIATVTSSPIVGRGILNYRHVFPGLWYPGTASKYAASAYRWLRDVMWNQSTASNIYQHMDQFAEIIPPGCDGLLFHPHLMGEWAPYWDEQMRGDFLGLTARHTRAHLTRSVLEGVAFALKDALTEMELNGAGAQDIRLIGQGARSDLWAGIICNVLNRRLSIPTQTDAVFGGALITAMGLGLMDRSPESVERMVSFRKNLTPSLQNAKKYSILFSIYREADASLRSISTQLHAFEREQLNNVDSG
jgi:xylulokinase